MARNLRDIFPAPEDLLQLEPEDIAPLLLEYLNQGSGEPLNRHNFFNHGGSELTAYAGNRWDEVARAVTEAWMFLLREVRLAPQPGNPDPEFVFVTRRGKSLKDATDFQAYLRGNLLPAKSLDPALATKVRPLFLRGDYDTAVFRAFKEVEVRVRAKAALPEELIGVKLMRKAFDANNGPLADTSRVSAEREATAHLFAGAIGLFKNSSSHRDVSYSAEEAADLVRFANYLISWVERLPHKTSPP